MKDRFGSPQSLKAAREYLSLSLDEIHELLNIKRQYLKALEEHGVKELEQIILPVYARGYHRVYTKYLRSAILNHLEDVYQIKEVKTKRGLQASNYWKLLLTALISLALSLGVKLS